MMCCDGFVASARVLVIELLYIPSRLGDQLTTHMRHMTCPASTNPLRTANRTPSCLKRGSRDLPTSE